MDDPSTFDDIRAEIERVRASVPGSMDGPPGFRLLPPEPGIDRLARSVQDLASVMEKLTDIVEAATERRGEAGASE
jgi:hypothetical protein